MWKLLVFSSALVLGGTVMAQTPDQAALKGRVLDPQGTGLPGVVASLLAPGAVKPLAVGISDIEGRFLLSGLAPARGLSLKLVLAGYASVVMEQVELTPGRTLVLNVVLRPAADAEETITVTARGETVDVGSTSTSATFNAEFIEGLPLLGRNLTDVLTLAPGVTDADGDGNVNVRGSRDTGLQLRLDGTNVTDPLTGHIGQQLNLEAVQELEVITGGAPAEFGQSDGGFANVITKSGTNDFQGSFKWFHRSDFLDGDGANSDRAQAPSFSDNDIFLTLGGPIVKNRLWYFGTIERIVEERPVAFANHTFGLVTPKGLNGFAKVTWQADSENRLSFQWSADPLRTGGSNIGPEVEPESDFYLRTGGRVPQIGWTSIASPMLLLQSTLSRFDGGVDIEPVSGEFRIVEMATERAATGVFFAVLPCRIKNCINEPGLSRFATLPGRVTLSGREGPLHQYGPYNFKSDQDVRRTTLRSDLTYTVDDRGGQHAIKSGFEFNVESYVESSINNPVLTDNTCETFDCQIDFPTTPPPLGARDGTMHFLVYQPLLATLRADAFRLGAYAQESWKPVPSLAVNLGIRIDREQIDSEGRTYFDPRPQAREALRRFDLICELTSCQRTPGLRNGAFPAFVPIPPGHPAEKLDLNGDGLFETNGVEGSLIEAPFTRPADLTPEPIVLANTNLSPRFSLSWDPWSDGRTKVFGNYGIYYDRLYLGSITTEQQPQTYTATWRLNLQGRQAEPGSLSEALSGVVSVPQTDRGLRTPYTAEWTAGFERELAPEWAVALTWISRRAKDLLQDVDINHITCKGFDSQFGVDPMDVCGDGGELELDRFGTVIPGGFNTTVPGPNGAPDLYALNSKVNQVLRVGNFNSSRYHAAEMQLRKRLHRNWQMQLSYTWSRAFGEAGTFTSRVGNDPAVSDKQRGFLDYDQRHILKWQAVAHLPHQLIAGGSISWASGLPYSFIANLSDYDDHGNLTPQRILSVSDVRNDHRNDSQLTVSGHLEKRLPAGPVMLTAFLDVENLLNSDELVLTEVDQETRVISEGTRRFGRQWQIGLGILF